MTYRRWFFCIFNNKKKIKLRENYSWCESKTQELNISSIISVNRNFILTVFLVTYLLCWSRCWFISVSSNKLTFLYVPILIFYFHQFSSFQPLHQYFLTTTFLCIAFMMCECKVSFKFMQQAVLFFAYHKFRILYSVKSTNCINLKICYHLISPYKNAWKLIGRL